MERNKVLISGLPGADIITGSDLIMYFQSRKKSGGGDVQDVQFLDQTRAVISFENEVVAIRVLQREHFIEGFPIQTSSPPMDTIRGAQPNTISDIQYDVTSDENSCSSDEGDLEQLCTVQVNGVSSMTTQDSLHNYFENKNKSKGGPVKRVVLKKSHNMATVVFRFQQDAKRVSEYQKHKLDDCPLSTSLIVPSAGKKSRYNKGRKESLHEDVPLEFVVSGMSEITTEDSLINYLENTRRSGGGNVESMEFDREDGVAKVKLQIVENLDRLLGDHHRLDDSRLLIKVKEPEKVVPMDPYKVHLKGLNAATTKDGLELYMEKMTNKGVHRIQFGSYGNALISFKEPPDFPEMAKKMANYKKGLEGCKPILEPVPYCCCVKISGLDEKTTEHAIILYFDNERKGCGAEPSRVDFQGQGSALVYFDDPFVIDKALGKRHQLDKAELNLEMFYPFLTEEITADKGRGTKRRTIAVEVDPVVMVHIMKNYAEDIQELQDDTAVELQWMPDETSVKLREKAAAKHVNGSWKEKVKSFEKFLNGFTCEKIRVEPSLWDEFLVVLRKELISTNAFNDIDITHDDSINEVRITGKKNSLQMVVNTIETLITGIHEDKDLQDSIETKVDKDLEPEKLALLKLSDLFKNISSKYKHTTIRLDEEKNEVVLHGPRKQLQEISIEMYMLFSKIKEEVLELPERVLRVLKTPKGTDFVFNSLRQNQIKAVLVYGQRKSKNEASIFAFNREQARNASMLIQSFSAERNIHLVEENIQVIQTPKWNDLVKDLEAQHKVNVVFHAQSQTLWISGVEPDVSNCSEVVESYIEKNTILNYTIVVRKGCARYIFQRLGKEIENIETKFADGFLKIQSGNDGDIILTGTNEEIKKGKEEVMLLVKSVCDKEITINKPGMKKFFKSSKGAKLIKAIESENSCAVEIVDPNQLEERQADFLKEVGNSQNITLGEIVCGYTTKEGKKVVVYKDDLTKHRVDVIVNAANENLQHVGGLARAIVSEGGHGIQLECDRYIRTYGSVIEGHVVETDPGQLPCKKLFHAVGPRWESFSDHKKRKETRKEEVLAFTFENCLQKARNFKSIAIPAVSSGIFGFPLDRCARILVETAIIFFRQNPECYLSEVHLTNNDDVTVKAFCDEMRKRFGNEVSFFPKGKAGNALHRSRTLSASRSASGSSSERVRTPEGVSISVIVGDISQETADVLVNTAGEDLDLQKNACARSFSSAAGPKLQTYCSRISPVQVGDIGVTQSGKLKCQYVFHAVTCGWDNGEGEEVLRGILRKCLKEAEVRGACSIAIPAIGTGVLQFPRNVVARIFFEEVFSFSSKSQPSTLKEVNFVLYEKDKPTIKAFTNEMASNYGSSSFDTPSLPKKIGSRKSNNFSLRKRRENWFEIDMDELSVQVQSGDITEENTDALVVISNPDLDLEIGGGAGTAILKVGGPSIKRECRQHRTLKPGEIAVTGAGRLNVKHLIHCVPSSELNKAMLIRVVLDCLNYSEQRGFSSISFPAIGTGNLGVPPETCAKAMLMALERFTKQKPKTVQLVRVVIYQETMVKDFYSKMKEFVGEMPDKNENPGIFRRFTNFIGFTSEVQDNKEAEVELKENSEIVLCVYSGQQTVLDGAVKAIREIVNENCTRKIINKDMIARMEQNNLRKIRTLERQFDCKIQVELRICRIIVEGSNEDVLSAVATVHDILHEVSDRIKSLEHAELLAEDVQWEYETDDEGFVPYSKELNANIENAYKNKRKDITFDDGEELKINFTSMTEYSKDGQTTVKRKSLKETSLPDYWSSQPKDTKSGKDETVHIVKLDPNKHIDEYLKISDSVKKTLPRGNKINKIERIQNPGQYKIYAARRQKMDEHNSKGSNEKMLFHGTSQDRCESINFAGFNRSYGQRNVWGHGVYFAVDASYSARSDYSPPDSQGNRYMYLARVLTGEYTLGNPSMGVPPTKNASNPTDTYDTVVDDVANPKIYVAFFDNQAYPEYLITFQ